MMYQQIHSIVSSEVAEELSEWLVENGALSVTLQDSRDQPMFEPLPGTTPLWNEVALTATFADDEFNPVLNQLKNSYPHLVFSQDSFKERDWIRETQLNFKPQQFGQRLWVCPTGYHAPHADAVEIRLDPGLAFGTGTHPTTRLCLEYLDQNSPVDQNVIDYGCGSGILSIAAARLGAKAVFCVDIDPQALVASRANAEINQVEQRLQFFAPHALPMQPVEMLLANILAQPLIQLNTTFAALVKAGGRLVLSGILHDQSEAVLAAYTPYFNALTVTALDGWLRIHGYRA